MPRFSYRVWQRSLRGEREKGREGGKKSTFEYCFVGYTKTNPNTQDDTHNNNNNNNNNKTTTKNTHRAQNGNPFHLELFAVPGLEFPPHIVQGDTIPVVQSVFGLCDRHDYNWTSVGNTLDLQQIGFGGQNFHVGNCQGLGGFPRGIGNLVNGTKIRKERSGYPVGTRQDKGNLVVPTELVELEQVLLGQDSETRNNDCRQGTMSVQDVLGQQEGLFQ